MPETASPMPSANSSRIVEGAQSLGIERDGVNALQWSSGTAPAQGEGDVLVDTRSGIFGHRFTMLDLSTEDLASSRQIGCLVEVHDRPGVVNDFFHERLTALPAINVRIDPFQEPHP